MGTGVAAAAGPGRVHREPAPAGADLDHVVVRAESEPVAHPLELRDRSLLERHPRAVEDRAGVHHRRVQHQLEQVVAEVVVGRDRLARAAGSARACLRGDQLERPADGRQALAQPVDPGHVARGQADDRDHVGRVPHATEVGLGEAAAATQELAPHLRRAHVSSTAYGLSRRPGPGSRARNRLRTPRRWAMWGACRFGH